MRRPTAIILIVLFALLVGAAILQFTIDAPDQPFPGPQSGTPLPPSPSATATVST